MHDRVQSSIHPPEEQQGKKSRWEFSHQSPRRDPELIKLEYIRLADQRRMPHFPVMNDQTALMYGLSWKGIMPWEQQEKNKDEISNFQSQPFSHNLNCLECTWINSLRSLKIILHSPLLWYKPSNINHAVRANPITKTQNPSFARSLSVSDEW